MSVTRLHELGITSNRESPCHGESNLSWVLTTRQALKGVCAISLINVYINIYIIYVYMHIIFVCMTSIGVKSKYGSCNGNCTGYIIFKNNF